MSQYPDPAELFWPRGNKRCLIKKAMCSHDTSGFVGSDVAYEILVDTDLKLSIVAGDGMKN